ncbi:MAG TPA: hypothetical protein VGE37_05190 [Archangium sp.]
MPGMTKLTEVHAPQDIVCPVLGSLVHEGRVRLRPDGTVPLDELTHAWRALGLSAPLRAGLRSLGYFANSPLDVLHNARAGELNVLDLKDGLLTHPADSGVLSHGRLDEDAFDRLTEHAEGGVMTIDAFARAIARNVRRDLEPGQLFDTVLRGMNASVVEFSGLLALFGRRDHAHGKLGISVDELRALYFEQRLPISNGGAVHEVLSVHALMMIKVEAALAAALRSRQA